MLSLVIVIAVPYALASLGGALTERSGMIDLAIEAKLLFGAFAAAAVGHATGSPALGILGGVVAGMAVTALQAGLSQWLTADQVIVGIALNLVADGGTRLLLQLLYHEGANSPPTPGYGDAVLGNPLVWITLGATLAVPYALRRTRWGLRLRAAGDRPEALAAVGVDARRARLAAGLVGGALSGAGGAQLALSVGGFVAEMSNGRGYIALAMVILSGWRPALAAVVCLAIALGHALAIHYQLAGVGVPSELVSLLPYVLTLVVLLVYSNSRPPASLGKV